MEQEMISGGVSILISTFNGGDKLVSTLQSILHLDLSEISFVQLIVVDNASTDGTSERVRLFFEQNFGNHPMEALLTFEKTPGKLAAQETGLTFVKGEFVLICDDDNLLNNNYLKIGVAYFQQHSHIGVLGGRGIAKAESSLPHWFEEYAYYFACAPQAPKTGNVNPTRNVVYGAGMWFRISAYRKAKELGFRFLLGSRTGTSLTTGGEDSELCWAIRFQNLEIWYVDEMQFEHLIPSNRLTDNYLKRLIEGMDSNGPYGGLYSRVWYSIHSKEVNWFWFKELMYSFKYLFKLWLSSKTHTKSIEIKRTLNNIRFYLKERFKYDSNVNRLLKYKTNCSQI